MPFDFVVPQAGQDHLSPLRGRVVAALGGWRPLAGGSPRRGFGAVVQYFLCGLGVRGA